MALFLRPNLNYPGDAQKKKKQGRVVVAFIVSKTGEIEDVKVEEGLYPSCDAEAIRVVQAMPKWTPAQKDGKPVAVIFRQAIGFRLHK